MMSNAGSASKMSSRYKPSKDKKKYWSWSSAGANGGASRKVRTATNARTPVVSAHGLAPPAWPRLRHRSQLSSTISVGQNARTKLRANLQGRQSIDVPAKLLLRHFSEAQLILTYFCDYQFVIFL
jgi:hypothetical protein